MSSVDVGEHVDWLLDQVEPVRAVLAELRQEGVKQDVFCYWATSNGQGGPDLGAAQMRRLGALELGIGFDIYLLPEKKDLQPETSADAPLGSGSNASGK